MNINLEQKANIKLHLHRRAFHHVNKFKPGMTVVCEKGIVWLTESSNPQDYMLRAGHQVVVGKRSNVLLEALSADADIRILYPN